MDVSTFRIYSPCAANHPKQNSIPFLRVRVHDSQTMAGFQRLLFLHFQTERFLSVSIGNQWIIQICPSIKIENHERRSKIILEVEVDWKLNKNGQRIVLWLLASTPIINYDSRIYFSFSFFCFSHVIVIIIIISFRSIQTIFPSVSLLFIYSNLMFRFVFHISHALSKCPWN